MILAQQALPTLRLKGSFIFSLKVSPLAEILEPCVSVAADRGSEERKAGPVHHDHVQREASQPSM